VSVDADPIGDVARLLADVVGSVAVGKSDPVADVVGERGECLALRSSVLFSLAVAQDEYRKAVEGEGVLQFANNVADEVRDSTGIFVIHGEQQRGAHALWNDRRSGFDRISLRSGK
jgi:hypothetical protein